MKLIKKAFIIGIDGQDGSYLANYLLSRKYNVYGSVRRKKKEYINLDYFNISKRVRIYQCDLSKKHSLSKLFKNLPNDLIELYNLAAVSVNSDNNYNDPINFFNTNTSSLLFILDNIKKNFPKLKFFQALSGEIFYSKKNNKSIIDVEYKNLYAISKITNYHLIKLYRKKFNLFVCSGILFPHESPLRKNIFFSKKIVESLVKYKLNKKRNFEIGNIFSKRDWGFAGDYVIAMHKMLKKRIPNDYIISSGKIYTAKYFIEIALKYLNIDYSWSGTSPNKLECIDNSKKIILKVSKDYYREDDTIEFTFSNKKTISELKWKPSINLKSLIHQMIDYQLLLEKKS